MEWLQIAGTGYLASLALIVAIGAQNAFILRQGVKGEHVFALCLLCGVLDALLISIGVAGFHVVVKQWPWLLPVAQYGGAAFLLWYGWGHARMAWQGSSGLQVAHEAGSAASLGKVVLTGLALTLLNPHVYLDTMVLLGSLSVPYGERAWVFGLGAATASVTFFFALGYGARLLRPVLATPRAWRILDGGIAITMWAIAVGLLLSDI